MSSSTCIVNVSRENLTSSNPKYNRYVIFNNIAIDGFTIGSGKTTTIDRVCLLLTKTRYWMDCGRLGGSNLRLLCKSNLNKINHYCLVCDDVLAVCSLPDKIRLLKSSDGSSIIGHNIDTFTAMGSPKVDKNIGNSYFTAKINSQNILNAAYGQLINCGVNELITRYGENSFSTDPKNPTNVILLYSRDINFAQIQFTLARILAESKDIKLAINPLLDEIRSTIIDKPFNFGPIRNHLIVDYDKCHAYNTKDLKDRKNYMKLCFENICKRNRMFETNYYSSFEFFYSFFNFQRDDDEAEDILRTIYNLLNKDDAYEEYWFNNDDNEPNTLYFYETIGKIAQYITDSISLLIE